jgi:quercetin dioxygenase-like cupin family protein
MMADGRSFAGAALIAALLCLGGCATVPDASRHATVHQPRAGNVPGGCSDPAQGRNDRVGCYLTATQYLGRLPDAPLFWHVYNYPDRSAAEADGTGRSTVVEAFGRIWLYSIEPADWRPRSGVRSAVVGPLGTRSGVNYTARYMEATFPPGLHTRAHVHSGPEAWYVLTGAQCLQTPDRTIIARAGEGALVPEGPPMVLSSIGSETRRSVLVVLHDASKPWTAGHSGWQPEGPCDPAQAQ